MVLVAGQPGIGKSTLLAQVAAHIAGSKSVLYVSGEESVSRVKFRAERLGAADSEKLQLASSNSAEDIAASIQQGGYDLVIVDSVQTISLSEISFRSGFG
ncbi:AAA family ATPase [Candidatus Minimicrobia naudis]